MTRLARDEDGIFIVELLMQLGHPLSEADVRNKMQTFGAADYRLIVYEIDQKVVGFIALHCFDKFHSLGKTGRITALCVDERLRQQGTGGILLGAAEEWLIENGCREIEVTTNMRRLQTPGFYKKYGFEQRSHHFVKTLTPTSASRE